MARQMLEKSEKRTQPSVSLEARERMTGRRGILNGYKLAVISGVVGCILSFMCVCVCVCV